MKFKVIKVDNHEGAAYDIHLVGANGAIIMCSDRLYTRKSRAMDAVKLMKAKVGKAKVVEKV